MALNTLNTDAISFKKINAKAHTQQGFSFTEESISSNISLSYSTVFGETINPIPQTSGLTSLYATDGVVERVKFDLEIIPDTLIGTNQSQGYRLKLPIGYTGSGVLGTTFSGGTKLHTSLGKLQLVPPLYGTLKGDGTTEYDATLYQTNGTTVIAKLDPIDWILDYYNGILFIQDPPAGYDVSALRPGYVEAFLYVGNYLDVVVNSGATEWADIANKPLTFPPSAHVHPISGVTGLQGILDNKIDISKIGASGTTGAVAPLNFYGIVPSIHLPNDIKEVFVVADLAERTARFVPSGSTPGVGQVESFEGLRVYMIDCTGAPELPTGTTGTCEFIDTDGSLNWSAVLPIVQVVLDWTAILGKPTFVNQIIAGAAIGVLPVGGTGNTTVSVKVDDQYIETTLPASELTVKELSLDPSRLKFQGGITGITGQYIVRGTGDTFQAINLPYTGVSTITVLSGITNIGTPTNPILIAQVHVGDNTIESTSIGLRVRDASIGYNKLFFGTGGNKFNADQLPINTGSTYTQATDVGTAIENLASGITNLNVVTITGATNIGTGNGDLFSGVSGNSLQFKNIKNGQYISLVDNGTDVIVSVTGISASTGTTIGAAEDGSYTDGLFTDFTPSTPVGTAIDRFNEVLKGLSPSSPSNLTELTGVGTFASGKLSFGSSKPIAGYTNVGTNAGNAAVDINGSYTISGTRIGITNTAVSGVINDSVVGGVGNIPYADNAFADGDKGKLVLTKNGVVLSQLILSGTTAATSNTYMSVTAAESVKFPNGQPLGLLKYRTGTFNIPLSAMTTGYNYIIITHTATTFNRQTNFLEWVYDADASNITLGGSTGLTNVTLGGTKYISGVKYHTGGTVQYQGTFSNVYKNIYSDSSTAIDFIGRENLGPLTTMNVTGAGIVDRLSSALQTLPILDIGVSDPQNGTTIILATLPINVSTILGNVGVSGRVRSSVSVLHPITSQSYSGGQSTLTGFLIYNNTQVSNLKEENFEGEVNRLEARNYAGLTYANVNSGTYAWDSTQNLISGDAEHNTGLLIFNGELMYPKTTYLTSTYGITTGNFGAVTYSPVGNPDYTSASLVRSYYRLFKSTNGTTQSSITFEITHTGINTDFLTNGGTGGTAGGNNLKFEFLIMRSGGAIHGWANPFAPSGNPEGIANTSSIHSGNLTTVTATLATTPRIAINDIVIVRIFAASVYTNRILNLEITNI